MIKANELRIGNWIWINYYDGNHSEQISFVDDSMPLEDYYPIPLTPEILEKAGFAFTDYRYYYGSYYLLQHEFEQNIFTLARNNIIIRPDIKYLHELQNIIFALIREELNIDLNGSH